MTVRERCDAAEVVWGRLLDRQDQLRLLALIARANGAVDMEDYEPPSARLTDLLAEEDEEPADRDVEIMNFVAEVGKG